jgi:hypothetical protein
MGIKKKPRRFSELAPKSGMDDSQKKVRTTQHLFRPLGLDSSELSR